MEKKRKFYRMADLEKASGLPRRTIHFYIQSGLLHQPLKTGKTMAYYDDTHVQKLKFIQKEKFKGNPLFLIKNELQASKEFKQQINGSDISVKSRSHGFEKTIPKKTGQTGAKGNRENIILQACIFFREKGYKQTAVSDITKALNVGKGTFYFYFKDKRELLLECVPIIFKDLFSEGWNIIRMEKDPLKRLELRAQTVFSVLSEFCAILQLCEEAIEDPDPKLKKMGRDIFLTIRTPLEADIENGISKGAFRLVDPKIISMIMIGIIQSMYHLKNLDKAVAQDAIWNNIIQVLMSGIQR
jgi:AcrR family transcriptional regulator